MSSKFWAHESGASGSDSDSDSDSDSSMGGAGAGAGARRQWAVDSDSESEEEVRVVKSAKDRSFEAIRTSVVKIRNHIKINDWNGIQADFDECNKHVDKSKVLIAKEGVPSFYVKLLANLEDLLTTTLKDKAAVKKMSATNTRSLNRMKLQLRKHNKGYEKEIADFRANPSNYVEESSESASESDSEADSESEDSSSDDDSSDDDDDDEDGDSDDDDGDDDDDDDDSDDDDGDSGAGVKARKAPKPQKNLEDMDSDDWGSDSDSDSESDDSDDGGDMLKGRAKWLKKTDDTDDKKKRKDEKRAAKAEEGKKGRKEKTIVAGGKEKGPPLKINLEITSEELEKKLRECLASRGRKATDPKDVLRQLSVLAYVARRMGPIREIPIIMYLVSAMFDTLRNIDEYMETAMWHSCRGYLNRVTDILEARPELTLGPLSSDTVADLIQVGTGAEVDESEVANVIAEVEKTGILRVVGSLSSYMMRLGEEYTKSLQSINPHTQEYIRRLKDESVVVELAGKVQGYYERQAEMNVAADLALLQAEHLYYQHESIARAVHKAQSFTNKWGKTQDLHPACTVASASAPSDGALDVTKGHPAAFLGQPTVEHEQVDYTNQLRLLCVTVYQHGDDRARTRAMLCHITHHALHDRFFPARDLLLMSHLQDNISQADVATQILYNRMMVTLGLCAFRKGMVNDAHDCLRDVCSSRVKELLAQGIHINRFQDKAPEQEKAERRRQTPYHMHINLDLLECCHLTSAMLMEVPNMAQESTELRRRVISKHFRRYVDIFNRQVFTGPPENIRDNVIAAAKRLMEGDWRRCSDLILGSDADVKPTNPEVQSNDAQVEDENSTFDENDDKKACYEARLDVWNLIPGESNADTVKAMVKGKIQSEALRTYIFTYSPHYESLSLTTLCEMFEMEKAKAHSIISKMMLNQELYGSWDQPTQTIVLRKEDPNTLQLLALKFADKAANLVESNERLIDARTGGYGYRDDGGRGRGRSDWNSGGRGGGNRDNNRDAGGGRGSGDWGGGRGYNRPGQTQNNRYQGGRGRGSYGGRGAGNYIRERRDMGVGPRR